MESGSPEVARQALVQIRKVFPEAQYHLLTCQSDPPPEIFADTFQVFNYPTAWQKLRLLHSFRSKKWEVMVILCTGEPIMLYWKMLAVLLIPAKVLIVNENKDFFWLDWENRGNARHLLRDRWGLNLEQVFYTLLRALVFPITLLILLSTAAFLYLRRVRRLLLWKFSGPQLQPSDVYSGSSLKANSPVNPESSLCEPAAKGEDR
jgi:hypothetical protein